MRKNLLLSECDLSAWTWLCRWELLTLLFEREMPLWVIRKFFSLRRTLRLRFVWDTWTVLNRHSCIKFQVCRWFERSWFWNPVWNCFNAARDCNWLTCCHHILKFGGLAKVLDTLPIGVPCCWVVWNKFLVELSGLENLRLTLGVSFWGEGLRIFIFSRGCELSKCDYTFSLQLFCILWRRLRNSPLLFIWVLNNDLNFFCLRYQTVRAHALPWVVMLKMICRHKVRTLLKLDDSDYAVLHHTHVIGEVTTAYVWNSKNHIFDASTSWAASIVHHLV